MFIILVFGFQFIYVNQSFAPAPDVEIGTLYDVSKHQHHLMDSVLMMYLHLREVQFL